MTAAVLILLPFHALITTWLGSNFGYLDAWRIWKEIVLFAIVPLTFWLALQNPPTKKWLKESSLARLMLAYAAIYLFMSIYGLNAGNLNSEALIYGLLANLRFIGLFGICLCLAARSNWLSNRWWQILLIPSVIVIGFGLLQLFLAPDFLRHFGYGPETIPALQTVDQKPEYQRIQSTLKGSNPLGAYLLLITTGLTAYAFRRRWQKLVGLLASAVALFFTYSRSAWLGTIVSAGLAVYWLKPKLFIKKYLIIGGVGLLVLSIIGFTFLRENDRFENTLFHTDENSLSAESSNTSRSRALKNGLEDVISEPLGRGPGTAGPASVRNKQPARIAENYYLQIGQEVGLVGLGIFIAIQIYLALGLWPYRYDRRVIVILASLVGLTIVNMISHAWADDTLGLLWWGLAGIAYGDVILNEKRKR